jgi:glycosyltransferase involved in cell wall biosynthesis
VRVVKTPDLGVSIARTGWDPWDSVYRAFRFAKEPFDVVHGFDCRPVVLGPSLVLRGLARVPWVTDWADWWGRGGAISERQNWALRVAFSPFETFLEERFRILADQVTVTSRALRDRAVSLGIRTDKVHYLPSGANVTTIGVLDRERCRREVELAPDAPVACFMGFVQYDLELVIRAFAVAHAEVPSARLLLVGPSNRSAERLAREHGIDSAIVGAGAQAFERIPLYLGAADVLLLPLSDNLMNRARGPIKLGDYLAAGRAILANPVGDLADVFRADDVGTLAPDAPEPYGKALAAMLRDPERCAVQGRNARRAAEEKYAWSLLAPRLEAVYDRARSGF